MSPYTAVTEPRRMVLTMAMLSAVLAAPIAGVDSAVAEFRIPDGSMFVLLPDQPMRLYLQAAADFSVPVGSTDHVCEVNTGGRIMLRSPRAAASLANHPDVQAWYSTNGGTSWTRATLLDVDFDSGEVHASYPATANLLRVYYTFGDGEIALKASRPFGSSSGQIQLMRTAARSLHETDQADRDAAPYAARTALPLPGGFTFSLFVAAASKVVFDGRARHEISIPMSETAISISDPVQLAELAERQLRGQ